MATAASATLMRSSRARSMTAASAETVISAVTDDPRRASAVRWATTRRVLRTRSSNSRS